ncbi:DUF6003 family protein [Streptomyces sp. NPDC007251]|uniref:DUF6003 family protein n=1 Tax=Streptomyces sp. NPDC007251 TaxID=3154483 RepID=UPI0033ED5B47
MRGAVITRSVCRQPDNRQSDEEAVRVQQECAPPPLANMERELLDFRDVAQDWEMLVHRVLTAGTPAPRIAHLTGLDPQEISRLTRS